MELLASDELGAVVVYECAECGYQTKERVEEVLAEEVLEPAEEDEVALQPEEEEEEFPEEEEEDEEFDDSLWEEEEEEEDAWR